MNAKRKKPSGFFILKQGHLMAGIAGLSIGLILAQVQPGATQASPNVESARGNVRVDLTGLGKPDPAVPAKLSLLATPTPSPSAAPAAPEAPVAASTPPAPPAVPELVGSIGYAQSWGNCVNEPGVNNPGYGNPISWPVLSETPTIGATALFTWNHTGVVTGIWANGDVEVRHQNYWGGQHRFPRSMFRGFR